MASTSAAAALPAWLDEDLISASPIGIEQLEEIVTDVGRSPWLWDHAISFDPGRQSRRVLYRTEALEIVLFGWAVGQETLFHDHGGASGAAFICTGTLVEEVVEELEGRVVKCETRIRRAQSAFGFGPDYIHRVRHDPGHGVALSLHAYTPAAAAACDYELRPDGTIRSLGGSADRATVGAR